MSEIKLPEPEINTKGTDGWLWWPISGYTADQMRAAILEERERCAKICDDVSLQAVTAWKLAYQPQDQGREIGADECAYAIRNQ